MKLAVRIIQILFVVLIIAGCQDTNDINSCPIVNYDIYFVNEQGKDSDTRVTVKEYCEAFSEMVKQALPSTEIKCTWENNGDNGYLLYVNINDPVSDKEEIWTLGIVETESKNALVTEFWNYEGDHFPAMFATGNNILGPYVLAIYKKEKEQKRK